MPIDSDSGGHSVFDRRHDPASSNSAPGGGGIANNGGALTLQNTIVSANTGNSLNPDIGGAITTDNGNNLLGTLANNTTTIPAP